MKLVKKIDIHVHTTEATWMSRLPNARYATPTELMDMYDQIGVEKGTKGIGEVCTNSFRYKNQFFQEGSVYDTLTLIPTTSWGNDETIPVISFDFS